MCLLEVQEPGLGATALQSEQPIAGGLSFLQIRGAESSVGRLGSDARVHFVGGEIKVCGGSVGNEAIAWSQTDRQWGVDAAPWSASCRSCGFASLWS